MSKLIALEKSYVVVPHNKAMLCAAYRVSLYILNKWLALLQPELGEPVGTMYSVSQMELIIKHYGVPGTVIRDAA